MNIIIDVTYLISGIYTNFRSLLGKKCNVGYYVINYGVMKLMTTDYYRTFLMLLLLLIIFIYSLLFTCLCAE